MNKLVILFLVVCLVSVHAFVKRDAPAPNQPDLVKLAENTWNELKEKVNLENIQKAIGEAANNINKALADFKPAEAPKA